MPNSINRTGWLLFCLVSALLLLPSLLTWGIFVDGLTYASISRNLMEGRGTFWMTSYTETVHREFFEQPPLVFFLQSWLFSIFGDHYLVEKLYSLALYGLATWLISQSWRDLLPEASEFSWLPPFICLLVSKWAWGFKAGILEPTVAVLVLSAFLAFLRSGIAMSTLLAVLLAGAAGLSVLLGIMSKGPVAAFVLVTPILLIFTVRQVSVARASIVFISAIVVVGVGLSIIAVSPSARAFGSTYFAQQLFPALVGVRVDGTGGAGRFSVLTVLAAQLAPLAVFALLLRPKLPEGAVRKVVLISLMLGCAGTFPLMISAKQRSFYIIPAIPFFAIGISAYLLPAFQQILNGAKARRWIEQNSRGFQRGATFAILAVVLWSASRINSPGRDADWQYNLMQLSSVLEPRSQIATSVENFENWTMHAYLERFLRVSVVRGPSNQLSYLLLPLNISPPPNQKEVTLELKGYRLFTRISDLEGKYKGQIPTL